VGGRGSRARPGLPLGLLTPSRRISGRRRSQPPPPRRHRPAGSAAAARDSAIEADLARIRQADDLERGSSGYLAAELEAAERNPLNVALQEEALGDDRFPSL
jgi:hypothetical protein